MQLEVLKMTLAGVGKWMEVGPVGLWGAQEDAIALVQERNGRGLDEGNGSRYGGEQTGSKKGGFKVVGFDDGQMGGFREKSQVRHMRYIGVCVNPFFSCTR